MSAGSLRKIDEKLQELNPDSLRYQVLTTVRLFRSTWIDLGRMLTDVAYGGDYKEWGFDTFESYCTQELGLKKPTVKKLMVSYTYMQRNAPDKLQAYEDRDDAAPPPDLPDYRTVELLQKVRENEDIEEEDKQRFHRLAFEDGGDETVLRKEIRGAMTATRPEESDLSPEKARGKELDDIRKSCRVLRRKLADSRIVPEGLRERFECLLAELEAIE